MILGVNTRFRDQKTTGVQRYASEAYAELCLSPLVTIVDLAPPDKFVAVRGGPQMWEMFAQGLRSGSSSSECVLSLANWGPLVGSVPSVTVVHDHLSESAPAGYSQRYRLARAGFIKALARTRSTIVTVSDRSRAVLEQHLGRPVFLAPPGVSAPALEEIAPDLEEMSSRVKSLTPFCLLVGAHDPRKNLAFVVELVEQLAGVGMTVVATARAGSRFANESTMRGRKYVHLIEDPTDRELWALYATASVVLQPSFGEGFGLPALEGMAMGTPFVSTDVGHASALAIDHRQIQPMVVERWLEAITCLSAEKGALSHDLQARAARYSWRKTADDLLSACAMARSGN